MDKIIMKNLGFYGYHGVLQEEKTIGQKFFIDVELYADLKKAGETDDLSYTINYATIYGIIKDITENQCFNLIEALGETIANKIFSEHEKVKEISITIKKPEAPVNGIYDYFGVELRRKRNG